MTDWKIALRDFLISIEGSSAAKTLAYYRNQLRVLEAWASERGIGLKDFRARDMRTYLAERSQTVNDRTRRHDAVTARIFFRFCAKEGYVVSDPLKDYTIPRAAAAYVKMPSDDEITQIIVALTTRWTDKESSTVKNTAASMRKFFMTRNKAIICGLIESASRANEMLSLRLDDYQASQSQIVIRSSKSKRPRVVPVGHQWIQIVDQWLKVRPGNIASDLLFVNEYGDPVTVDQLGKTFRKYCAYAGVEGITLHSLRHYAITTIAKTDLWAASQIAGHQDLTITRAYLHGDPDHVRAMHAQASPLSRIMVNKRSQAAKKKRII